MRLKLITLLTLALGAWACNTSDNSFVTISGNGELNVEHQSSVWLYRLIVKGDPTQITTYLLGAFSNIDSLGVVYGSGAAVYFTTPNGDGVTTLQSLSASVDEVPVYYSRYVNFAESDDMVINNSFETLTTGSVEVVRDGSLYKIEIYGEDSAGREVSVLYTGAIYENYFSE